MFRMKSGVRADYNRQGYIYFVSRQYKNLAPGQRREIDTLCRAAGGAHFQALHEFVTTDATATALCMKHYVSRATLYRAVRRYYDGFPTRI